MLLLEFLGGESANTCGEIYIGDFKPYRELTTDECSGIPTEMVIQSKLFKSLPDWKRRLPLQKSNYIKSP